MAERQKPLFPVTYSPSEVDDVVASWRRDLSTTMLWLTGAFGVVLVAFFVPGLVAAGSWGILALAFVVVGGHLFLAWRTSLPAAVRAGWLALSLTTAAVPAFLTDGDRGIATSQVLAAVGVVGVMVGWRAALVVAAAETGIFVLLALGYARGVLPLPSVIEPNWNTPAGWFALWLTAAQTGAFFVASVTFIFQRMRALLAERHAATLHREQVLRELVREREERLKLSAALDDALASVRAGLWEFDLRTGAVTWSDGVYALLDVPPGTAPTMAVWTSRLHPDDLARMSVMPSTERSTADYRYLLPDGRVRWVRGVMHTTFDAAGAPVRLRGLLTDITAERATALQLRRLAEVASRTGNAVVVTDLQGHIEWVNDAFARLTGWTLDDVRGRRPGSFLQGPHTDGEARARMAGAIAAREPFDCEVLNVSRDGRQYWVHIEARVARDDHGEPSGFIAVETDITERRLAARRDGLSQRVAALLLSSDTVEEAGQRLVNELVQELDVRAAQFWVVAPGIPHLVYVAGAAAEVTGAAGQEFLARTRALTFSAGRDFVKGVGVPGTAWGTRQTATLPLIAQVGSRRLEASTNAGLHSFCGTPVFGPDGVLAVLEVGGTPYYPGHELIPNLLERIAEQIASFLLHDATRRAFQSVFERSPDAMLLVGEQGDVRDANARASALFGVARGVAVDGLIDGGAELVRSTLGVPDAPDDLVGAPLVQRAAHGVRGDFSAEVSAAVAPLATSRAVIVAVRDLTERHRMEAALTASLREKETLLREVHHRVKNNLQIVSSLITLQAESLELAPARAALAEMVYRVRSMSYVHQQLYGTDHLDRVDLGEYARTLANALVGSLDPSTSLTLDVAPVTVSVDVAVPCGLVLNELLTNALKHGRDAEGRCALRVIVARDDAGVWIEVRDHGRGFPDAPGSAGSLGMQLIRTLGRQLRAKVSFASDGGAVVSLRFAEVDGRSG
jgi:PAS domain S-box-containing protein